MKKVYEGKYFDINQKGIQISIAFKMEVELDEEMNFSGKVWEEEFSSATNQRLSVKGFIDEDHISFVKKYPCLYTANEQGEIIIDNSKDGHEVIYDGYWDDDKKIWMGEWEVEGQTNILHLDFIETEVFTGAFEMMIIE